MTPSDETKEQAELLIDAFEKHLVDKEGHRREDPVTGETSPDKLVASERVLLRTFLLNYLEGELTC
jgi:hypothetical protein